MENNTNNKITNQEFQFSVINPYVDTNIPSDKETKSGDVIFWGDGNKYSNFLWGLYLNSPTLGSSINTIADFITGNLVSSDSKEQPNSDDSWNEFVHKIAINYLIFGGFAIQVIRDFTGRIAELYAIDFNKLRLADDGNVVVYKEKGWDKCGSTIRLPRFDKENPVDNSVFYYKGTISREYYPVPLYKSAVKSALIETKISDYHLNAISNGFSASFIINFNNGRPNDKQKEEIERAINNKFSGNENAGRIFITYNDNKDNAVSVEKLDSDNFDKKYESLTEAVKTSIYSALRMNPVLLGYNYTSGFSPVEYNQIFQLFQRTTISPIQTLIEDTVKKITGWKIKIDEFKINFGE